MVRALLEEGANVDLQDNVSHPDCMPYHDAHDNY